MTILVSGDAGYIGSHTCVELLNEDYDIVVVDNDYNSCPTALARVKEITGKDFRFYHMCVHSWNWQSKNPDGYQEV